MLYINSCKPNVGRSSMVAQGGLKGQGRRVSPCTHLPQAPQLVLFVSRLVLQPVAVGLQSPQPASQVQLPLTQCSWSEVAHLAPHLPQLVSEAIRFTSQPASRCISRPSKYTESRVQPSYSLHPHKPQLSHAQHAPAVT